MSTTVGFPGISGLEPWEKEAIIGFHRKNPLEGYRRLTFMMLDAEIHAARDHKLEEARRQRQLCRQQAAPSMFAQFRNTGKMPSPGETEAGSAGTQPC